MEEHQVETKFDAGTFLMSPESSPNEGSDEGYVNLENTESGS